MRGTAESARRIRLTVAGFLASPVDESNVDELLAECEGMTKRQAEEHLIVLRPKPVFKPSIRKQPSRPAPKPDPRPRNEALKTKPSPKPIVEPARPETVNFHFAADRDFKEKFERLAEVLGVENVQGHLAEIFEHALDIALDKKDPKKKAERRQERERKPRSESSPDDLCKKESDDSRYIASAVRERVFARADYQCEYEAEDCPSRHPSPRCRRGRLPT